MAFDHFVEARQQVRVVLEAERYDALHTSADRIIAGGFRVTLCPVGCYCFAPGAGITVLNTMLQRVVFAACVVFSCLVSAQVTPHVWELQEIEFQSSRHYANPYVDVQLWVELKGPGFSHRVYGFWDGGDVFRVRVVASAAGKWSWTSGSNQPGDRGLNGKSGAFTARAWSDAELRQNPNRRGFLRATANGHALQYADGTPFFMLGDTWLGAATWRLPLTGDAVPANYEPGPNLTFEQAVQWRKRQGYNSVSMIAAFPTWASDQYPATYADSKGVFYRNAWEEFGVLVGDKPTAKSMHDERGYLSIALFRNISRAWIARWHTWTGKDSFPSLKLPGVISARHGRHTSTSMNRIRATCNTWSRVTELTTLSSAKFISTSI